MERERDALRSALRNAEKLARWFHEEYEARAIAYGYETRRASAVPWPQVPEPNRGLMVEVVEAVVARVLAGECPTCCCESPTCPAPTWCGCDGRFCVNPWHERNRGDT